MALNPRLIASTWLAALTTASQSGDGSAFAALFLPNGWLRDLLVFTWDIHTLEGRDKVAAHVANTLANAQIRDVKLDDTAHLAPEVSFLPQIHAVDVEFAITFECRTGHGRGHIRLLPDQDGTFRALTALLMLSDLRGYEEQNVLTFRDDTAAPGRDLQKDFTDCVHGVETNPHVLIGESHAGMNSVTSHNLYRSPKLVPGRPACKSQPASKPCKSLRSSSNVTRGWATSGGSGIPRWRCTRSSGRTPVRNSYHSSRP